MNISLVLLGSVYWIVCRFTNELPILTCVGEVSLAEATEAFNRFVEQARQCARMARACAAIDEVFAEGR